MTRNEPDPENISPTRRTEITNMSIERRNKAANNKFLTCQFILGANNKRCKNLKTVLANRFVFGSDNYPKDTTQALALLKNYKDEGGKTGNNNSNSNSNSNKDESPGVVFI